jgi:DNA replication licensing factor MCM3
MEYLPLFEKALKTIVESIATNKDRFQRDDEFYIGFEGAMPHREVNPRTLLASEHMGKLVVLEGIVTRCICFCMFSTEIIAI